MIWFVKQIVLHPVEDLAWAIVPMFLYMCDELWDHQ